MKKTQTFLTTFVMTDGIKKKAEIPKTIKEIPITSETEKQHRIKQIRLNIL